MERHRRWIAVVLVAVVLFGGWRWHEAHLPTPLVPSTWVNWPPDENPAVTMVQWVITGQSIMGIYTSDDLASEDCMVAPFVGSIDGRSFTLTVTYLDGSGTTQWWGTVYASKLLLRPTPGGLSVADTFVPRSATWFAQALAAMHEPPCGPANSP
jgi:hypothetical protein